MAGCRKFRGCISGRMRERKKKRGRKKWRTFLKNCFQCDIFIILIKFSHNMRTRSIACDWESSISLLVKGIKTVLVNLCLLEPDHC